MKKQVFYRLGQKGVSLRRTSNTRSKGCFVKKFYDLPKANLSHAEECLKCGILLIKDLCRWRRHGG